MYKNKKSRLNDMLEIKYKFTFHPFLKWALQNNKD